MKIDKDAGTKLLNLFGYWAIDKASKRELHCLHPWPIRRLIDYVLIKHMDGADSKIECMPTSKSTLIGTNGVKIGGVSSLNAYILFRSLSQQLERLNPQCRQDFEQWTVKVKRNRKMWKGLSLIALCSDHAIQIEHSYTEKALPLLLVFGLIGVIEASDLAVLMRLNARGRILYSWLSLIIASTSCELGLLRSCIEHGIRSNERLLALDLLANNADQAHVNLFSAGSDTLAINLWQYWEGKDTPADVARLMDTWVQSYSSLRSHRLNAPMARDWLMKYGEEEDLARFDKCWHPAMQSDFLRVAATTLQGGIYLDCDTPAPETDESKSQWIDFSHFCIEEKVLALVVNVIRRPAVVRDYVNNCCIWAAPGHPTMLRWLSEYRLRLDQLDVERRGQANEIHKLGPDLAGDIVEDELVNPSSRMEALCISGHILPRVFVDKEWSIVLISRQKYKQVFGVDFSCHVSYQSCGDPKDWKTGIIF